VLGGPVDLGGHAVVVSAELRLVSTASAALAIRNGLFSLRPRARVRIEGFAAVELRDLCVIADSDDAASQATELPAVLLLASCGRSVLIRVSVTAGRSAAASLLECRGSPRGAKKRSRLCGLSMFGCQLCGLQTRGPATGAALERLQCVRICALRIAVADQRAVGLVVRACSNCAIDRLRVSFKSAQGAPWSFEDGCSGCVLYEPGAELLVGRVSPDSQVIFHGGASP
jgi:hypothetical protein